MNRTAMEKVLSVVIFFALVAWQGTQSKTEGQGSASRASQSDAPAVGSEDIPPEIRLRDGSVTKGYLSKEDWSQVRSICFPDCKGEPLNDSDTDLI
ncbi:MAG: hypothetical protein ACREDR_16530, partial [Blastocatellia bacterium]